MESLLADIRYAFRSLIKSPGFTITATLTLALGIALNTTTFSIYDGIALRPLAVPAPGDVVRVVAPRDRSDGELFPYASYQTIQEGARSLAGVVATSAPELLIVRNPQGESDIPASARFVSGSYFPVLRVVAARGRGLTPTDENAVVVSDAFWRSHLGADPAIPGAFLMVQGRPMPVVGVMPAAFAGTGSPPATPDLWIPAAAQPSLLPGADWLHDRGQRQWQILARLAPHQTVDAARAELAALAPTLAPVDTEAATLRAKPATLFQTDSGEFQTFGQVMVVLLIAVVIILFIGAGNLVGLVAARNASRDRELAVRAALGASRGRIGRLLVMETLVLSLAGGTVGLLVATWLGDVVLNWLSGVLRSVSGGALSLALDLSPDWRIVGFTVVVSVLVGLAVGAWPTLQAARRDLHTALKGTTGGGVVRTRGHRLLSAQLAVSLVLLSGAGLLIGGARRARHVDPGFDAGHVLLVGLDTRALSAGPSAQATLFTRVTERLRQLSDVRAVAWTDRAPFAGHAFRTVGYPTAPVTFSVKGVSPDYFEAIGARLVSGRTFTAVEAASNRGVMVISESVARRYWPGQDPVGRTVADHPWLARTDSQAYSIIGVVADMRATYLSRVDEGLYYPEPLGPRVTLVLRTRGAPSTEAHQVLAALAALDPTLPTKATVMPLEAGPLRVQQLMSDVPAVLAGGFALVGLVLAAVGLYGVVVQLVARRTREIGIRVALGASWREVVTLVLRGSLRPALWGAAVGLLGAVGASAGFASLFAMPDAPDLTYGRGTFDPLVLVAVLSALTIALVVGSIGPARRALKVDPMEALRTE